MRLDFGAGRKKLRMREAARDRIPDFEGEGREGVSGAGGAGGGGGEGGEVGRKNPTIASLVRAQKPLVAIGDQTSQVVLFLLIFGCLDEVL